MSFSLQINLEATKTEKYLTVLPQLESLLQNERDLIAGLANTAALLKQAFDFFWVGFYLRDDVACNLVLGPFQGTVACTRIAFTRGVCGACYTSGQTQLVPNVHEFPGHIACDVRSQSEIVLPAFESGKVRLVLDIDSDRLNDFNQEDQHHLEKVMRLIEKYLLA
ncbi:MAG: GAF domain-containing protein [Cytophagales bacterium]|nr:MAG: GAF domain-containing protein [Cytophagales bacterium]